MKAIGVVVLLLLVALGVATFLLTRPPDRTLSASEHAWVERYVAWTKKTERLVDDAYIGVGSSSARKNSRLLDPLRACSASFERLGDRPALLRYVDEAARSACGEAEYAVQLNDDFAVTSFATTKLHLQRAGEWLVAGRDELDEELDNEEARR